MQRKINFADLSEQDKQILYAFLTQSTTGKFYSVTSLQQLTFKDKDWKHSNEKTGLPYILRDPLLGTHHLLFSQNIHRVIDNQGKFTNQFVVASGEPSYDKRERSKGLKVLATFSLDDDNHTVNIKKDQARQLKIQKEALEPKEDKIAKQKNARAVAKAYQKFSDCGELIFAQQSQGFFKSKMLIPYYPGVNLEHGFTLSLFHQLTSPNTKNPAIGHVLMQLFIELERLHELDFVHCDLKLENLLYSVPSGKASLIDFDLSRPVGFMHDGAPGNPETMAPEVLDRYIAVHQDQVLPSFKLTTAIDLYSLGVVLLQILTQNKSTNFKSTKLKFFQITSAEEANAVKYIKLDELQFSPGYNFGEEQTSLLKEIVIGLTKHEPSERMPLTDVKQKLIEAFPYLADTIENSHEAKGMRP